jgi:RNA-directed DNA polymerase
VDIPKPNGETRMLGIPTVLDRTIQQAIVMVIEDAFEPQFSEHSYGFRKSRNAQQAVQAAQQYVKDGHTWVVETDLSKFFDRVNHDILMSRIAKVIDDKPMLKLIRRYLNTGIMENGVVIPREEGVPQGSPLSPLLSNIMLTELDWELERRGLKFCRYADDCNVYVKSEKAAERVLASLTRYVEEVLKLRVNRDKSGTFRPCDSVFLGYSFSRGNYSRIVVAEKPFKRLKNKLRHIFRTARGTSLKTTIQRLTPILRGWRQYFKLDERKRVFEELDAHIRRHLRKLIWVAWKNPKTRERNLLKRGLPPFNAWKSSVNGRGKWWNAGAPHMNIVFPRRVFARLGLYSLASMAIC